MIRRVFTGGGSALLGVAACLIAVSPATAAPQRPPATSLGFAIEAVGQPSYFIFDARPGELVRGALRVRSTGDRARTVFLRSADANTASTGGLDYGEQGRHPVGTGSWIHLQRTKLRLPAGGAVEVPFTARIPRGVRSGDHVGGILAFGRSPGPVGGRSHFRLRLISRLAIALQFRVPGPRRVGLELRDASVKVVPSGAFLGIKLANTGNTLVPFSAGRVSVFQGSRRLFTRRIRIDSFVPQTEITYPVSWFGKPVEGKYRVEGYLQAKGGEQVRIDRDVDFAKKRIREFRRETGRQAVEKRGTSPAFIALLLIMLGCFGTLGIAYLRAQGLVGRERNN